ncbi:MAG: SH3 domain-containing protein [Oscillospiraceae bacterium]|nr:SH3 domain-containing protein [Oscillospiraceae bacterium]
MNYGKRILAAALSAAMLSGLFACGKPDSSTADTTEPATAATTETTTVSTTELTTELTTDQETTVTTDPALTTLSETERSSTTAVQSNRNDWLDSISTLVDGGYVAKLRCTGTVQAKSGVNLREKPGTSSKSLRKLKDGTKLEITGLTAAGSVTDFESRWLRVNAGGQEGYVCAEYVLAECSTPLSALSGEEIGALGILMYYQGIRLYLIYQREGGLNAGGMTETFDEEGFCRLKPDGMTLAQLRTELHRWFTADFQDDFAEVYREKDGALWIMTGYGDNVALEYTIPEKLTGKTDTELNYEIRAQWFPDFDAPLTDTKSTTEPFKLRYEDGKWKIAAITQLY